MAYQTYKSDLAGVTAFTGSTRDVGRSLAQSDAKEVLAIALDGSPESAAVRETMLNVLSMLKSVLQHRESESLNFLLQALAPTSVPPAYKLAETRMAANMREAVLAADFWLTSSDIAKLAGFSEKNPSAQPNKWKAARKVFAVSSQQTDYFPEYILDPRNDYRPYPVVREILDLFKDRKDGWKTAAWFQSANSFLGGCAPYTLIATQPQRVLDAARDEVAGVLHG